MFGNWVADLRMVMDLLRHVTVHRIKLGCQTKRLQKDLQRPWTRHHSQGHAFLLSYGKVLRVAEGWICLICGTSWYYHFAQGLYIYICRSFSLPITSPTRDLSRHPEPASSVELECRRRKRTKCDLWKCPLAWTTKKRVDLRVI